MFIAMNCFRVKRGSEEAFEQVWLNRDSQLTKVPGFVEFHLLKGPEHEDHTLYSSHTVWQSKATFEAWTKSEPFRLVHQRRRGEQAALPRSSAVRRLRGPPDRASRRSRGGVEHRHGQLQPSAGIRRCSRRSTAHSAALAVTATHTRMKVTAVIIRMLCNPIACIRR